MRPKCENFGLNGRVLHISSYIFTDKLVLPSMTKDAFSKVGAFAKFVKIPFENLVEVPDNISLEKAALSETIACGWSAVRKCSNALGARFNPTKAVVICGGAIGVGAALSSMAQGFRSVEIIEPQESGRKFIQDHIGLEAVAETSPTPQFDIVIGGVGISATRLLFSHGKSQAVLLLISVWAQMKEGLM